MRPTRVFDGNVTHNLTSMAGEAGVYMHLWRPTAIGVTHAAQLIEPLRAALSAMRAEPERFKRHNPKNNWGDYEGFLRFLDRLLLECENYPDAEVSSRP